MSYTELSTNDSNNINCSITENNKYYICSKYNNISNNTVTLGTKFEDINSGKAFHTNLDHAFNNITFANNIDSNNNIININNCNNNEECKNKISFAKTQKSTNDILSLFNNLDNPENLNENLLRLNSICKELNVCSYKSDNKFLLKKTCNNNVCNYDVYCECHKD